MKRTRDWMIAAIFGVICGCAVGWLFSEIVLPAGTAAMLLLHNDPSAARAAWKGHK